MYALEIIVALNQKAREEEQTRDARTVRKVIAALEKGYNSPAALLLKKFLDSRALAVPWAN